MQIKLTYFRNSGKKFGQCDYTTENNKITTIVNEIRGLKIKNTLPETKEIDVIVLVQCEIDGQELAHLVI